MDEVPDARDESCAVEILTQRYPVDATREMTGYLRGRAHHLRQRCLAESAGAVKRRRESDGRRAVHQTRHDLIDEMRALHRMIGGPGREVRRRRVRDIRLREVRRRELERAERTEQLAVQVVRVGDMTDHVFSDSLAEASLPVAVCVVDAELVRWHAELRRRRVEKKEKPRQPQAAGLVVLQLREGPCRVLVGPGPPTKPEEPDVDLAGTKLFGVDHSRRHVAAREVPHRHRDVTDCADCVERRLHVGASLGEPRQLRCVTDEDAQRRRLLSHARHAGSLWRPPCRRC